MKATMLVSLVVLAAATSCTQKPAVEVSTPPPPHDTPMWEIGEDIAGKTVIIDGKEVVVPEDAADTKRKMDAAAKESLDAMDALEKRRLERFNDPDMKP